MYICNIFQINDDYPATGHRLKIYSKLKILEHKGKRYNHNITNSSEENKTFVLLLNSPTLKRQKCCLITC